MLSSRRSPSRGKPLPGVDLELPSAQGSGLRQLWCGAFDPSLSPVLVETFAPGKGLMYPPTRSPILLACTVALGQLGYLTLQWLVNFRDFLFGPGDSLSLRALALTLPVETSLGLKLASPVQVYGPPPGLGGWYRNRKSGVQVYALHTFTRVPGSFSAL